MPTYVVFLRAVNLGQTRKFGKDDLRRVTEAAGFADVETYLTSGNVRVTGRQRSRARVEEALETAYAADRGFEVPTIAFRDTELADVAAAAEELEAARDEPGEHYLTLLKDQPDPVREADLAAVAGPGERAAVRGRAVHLLMPAGAAYRSHRLDGARVEKLLGTGTTRTLTVIRELSRRWC